MVDADTVMRKLDFDNSKPKVTVGNGALTVGTGSANSNNEELEKQKIWYTGLLLLGILYCKATDMEKATVFHDLANKS